MIGIDLVNLQDPLLKKRDERALKLIAHTNDHCPDHPLKFWLLWTAKEAVFKAQRIIQTFAPTAIPIQIEFDSEHINFISHDFTGKIIINSYLVIAVCSTKKALPAYCIQKSELSDLSLTVREATQVHFFNLFKEEVSINRDEKGLPIISPLDIPVSFSHHAGYIGFCWPTK